VIVALGLAYCVTVVSAAIVLVRRERAAARAATEASAPLKEEVEALATKLREVDEVARQQNEIMASIDVVRRLTGDPDTTTGPHNVVLLMPGREAPARPRKEAEREGRRERTARRTSSAN
jgi:hypothetical protein